MRPSISKGLLPRAMDEDGRLKDGHRRSYMNLVYAIHVSALVTFLLYLWHSQPSSPATGPTSPALEDEFGYRRPPYPPPFPPGPGVPFHPLPSSKYLSREVFLRDLKKCLKIRPHHLHSLSHGEKFKSGRNRNNPRATPNARSYLIKNATIWDGQGNVLEQHDVLLKHGLIWDIGKNIVLDAKGHATGSDIEIIEANGRIVTPGIVDMHSHAGVGGFPELRSTDDTNEYGDPTIPQMKSIDGFNPHDKGIPLILSGGVTTMLVLPGSGNLMGGEGYAVKPRKPLSNSVEEMLVQYNLTWRNKFSVGGNNLRWMKMACGENPKGYGTENKMPFTRMGSAFLVRKKFSEALVLKNDQDDWCNLGFIIFNSHFRNRTEDIEDLLTLPHPEHNHDLVPMPLGRFPENVALESTVAVLRGQVKLNIHCYETYDIEAFLRITREYGVQVAAFHHALDAYRIPEVFKRHSPNTTMAIFSDLWGYKKEAFQASAYAGKILKDNNIPFAFKSDHPVINSQYLVYEAGKSRHYGLNEQDVIKALTSTPAKALGLDYRVGSVAVGMDADIVIWSSNPFHIGSLPVEVFVDGISSYKQKTWPGSDHTSASKSPVFPTMGVSGNTTSSSRQRIENLLIINIGTLFSGPSSPESVKQNVQVLVQSGVPVCIDVHCDAPPYAVTLDLKGGNLYPSFVSAGTVLGFAEISQEEVTHDGSATPSSPLLASDGLLLGHKHQKSAANAGVNVAISAPEVRSSNSLSSAVSVAYRVDADYTESAIIKKEVALHVAIGESVKEWGTPLGSVSGQIASLRNLFMKGYFGSAEPFFRKVVYQSLPLAIEVNSADHILSLLSVKKEIDQMIEPNYPKMKWILVGAAEVHLVAQHLAGQNVSVLFQPARCVPDKWSTRRCLSPPKDTQHAATILKKYNIPFAVSTNKRDLSYIRTLMWEANWIRHLSEPMLSEEETVELASFKVAELFGLTPDGVGVIAKNQKMARIVATNGSILEIGNGREIQAIIDGPWITFWPKQD